MGSFSSKILKNNCTEVAEEKDKSVDKIQIPDPRSSTDEIIRTPITVESDRITPENGKGVKIKENSEMTSSLMRQRLLKNLKLDPRSPTEGINRTPILLDTPYAYKSSQACNAADSPLSIYSTNFNNSDSFTDVTTPQAPPVNVSGFETYDNVDESIHDVFKQDSSEENNLEDEEDENQCAGIKNITKTPLKVSSKPSTVEARRILNEILSSKDFNYDSVFDGNKHSKSVKQKNLPVHCDNEESRVVEKERSRLKHRTPLSNITLASNSPNNVNSMKKPYARCKIMSNVGLENSVSPKVRQIAEWDKDKTVII